MSQRPSIPSIGTLEISSAGRFSQDCAKPWALNHLNEQGQLEGDQWWFEIECAPDRILSFHGSVLEAPEAPDFCSPGEKVNFAIRRVCHLLIDQIDTQGLQDVCQSLVEFYEYYRPAEESRNLLPESRTRDATIGTRTVRPAFIIEEE